MTAHDFGQPALGPFALYLQPPMWIGDAPASPDATTVLVWSGTGPDGVPLHARRDGFIVFDFPAAAPYAGGAVPAYAAEPGIKLPGKVLKASEDRMTLAYQRFQYMNAFLAALYSGLSTVQQTASQVQEPANPTNYFHAVRRGETFLPYQAKIELKPVTARNVMLPDTIAHAAELMQCCVKVFEKQGLILLSLVYIACHQYQRHQFAAAHLIAWSVIEKQINHMWEALLNDLDLKNGGRTAISRERRRLLLDHDYTASVVSQMLSLHGRIDDEMLQRLDAARRRRNEFAHRLAAVSADDAGKAIRAATDLMTMLLDFRVTSQLGMSFFL